MSETSALITGRFLLGIYMRKLWLVHATKGLTEMSSLNATNTAGASPSSTPSTPSAHSPGDTISAPPLLHNASLSKALIVYGSERLVPTTSATNSLVDMDHYVEDDSMEDNNVEPILSCDDMDLRSAGSHCINSAKGYILREMSAAQASTSSVLCCHFSSDGELLATGGQDKKVFLWNAETLKQKSIWEEHSLLITDVCFSPSTPRLATSSFDKTVRVWDADNQDYSIRTFTGHSASVMSIDFYPNKDDLICSCGDNEIRFWNIKHGNNARIFKVQPADQSWKHKRVLFAHKLLQFVYPRRLMSTKSDAKDIVTAEALQPFQVKVGNSEQLCRWIENELDDVKVRLDNFENRYRKVIRPLLASRALLLPPDLKDPGTLFSHQQTQKILNFYPNYLSSYDVMEYSAGVRDDEEWDLFLKHMADKRVCVVEDMDMTISTVETLFYDHGVRGPVDGTASEICKGECDASFRDGTPRQLMNHLEGG